MVQQPSKRQGLYKMRLLLYSPVRNNKPRNINAMCNVQAGFFDYKGSVCVFFY